MKVAVDISLYPLDADFIPPIKDVIARLNDHERLEVWTNAMSTQVVGEFDDVMDALRQPGSLTCLKPGPADCTYRSSITHARP